MTQVYVICEGRTEVVFVKNLLDPYFSPREIFLAPTLIGKTGGGLTFDKLLKDVRNLLPGAHKPYCTTFFDFYGLPSEFPGKNIAVAKPTPREKATTVCSKLVNKLKGEIDEYPMQRFIPYVQMYEFEGLLFSDPGNFAKGIGKPNLQRDFARIREEFNSPEHINDSQHTSPSKRIKILVPRYRKPLMGENAAKNITLAKIRAECPLFDAWLKKLENLPPLPT